ncbi:hypothetical protein LOTGIDRAFT_126867, partial [Lottia gigantea]
RYYGSGFLIPEIVDGANVLDLGCGSGSLVFVLSKLVGIKGRVTGHDLTPAFVNEAEKYINYHREKWGYNDTNVTFKVGNIEKFDDISLPEQSQDVIVSNGVICLCPNKKNVFTNVYRLLKDGGEFCLSDFYADRDRTAEKLHDPKLFSLGTTGSMKWDDVGFTKPYLVDAPVVCNNKEIHAEVANAEFLCAEYRFFKLPQGAKRSAAEVTYKGNIQGIEDVFQWDINTTFKVLNPVDSDLTSILAFSRYKDSFIFKDTDRAVKTPNVCSAISISFIMVGITQLLVTSTLFKKLAFVVGTKVHFYVYGRFLS